jgi:hypothetical protein
MGTSMQLYSNAYVTMDSAVLTEAGSIRIHKNPNLNLVSTLAKGLAGVTLGAGMCEITVETAVPSADFEVNPDPFMIVGKQVELGAVVAGRQMQSKMFITGSELSAGVGQPTNLTISLVGPLAPWE